MFYFRFLGPVLIFLMMVIVGSTGTDAKRAYTSLEVIHFPYSSLMFFDLFHRVLCVADVVGRMAYQWSEDVG